MGEDDVTGEGSGSTEPEIALVPEIALEGGASPRRPRVRPLTMMAAVAVIALLVAGVAWWRHDEAATVVQPAALPLTQGSSTAMASSPVSTVVVTTTYVRGPGLDDLGGTAPAWRLTPTIAADRVATLAEALHVDGTPVADPDGTTVGSGDGPTLYVGGAASSGAWQFGAMSTGVTSCPGSAPLTTETTVPPTTLASEQAGSTTGGVPVDCTEPAPPTGLPDTATAEAATRDIAAAAGFDPATLALQTHADTWRVEVEATPQVGGRSTSWFATSVSFGQDGAVTAASGFLATPMRVGTYPLVGLDAAIDRLNRGADLAPGVEGTFATGGATVVTDSAGAPAPTVADDSTDTGAAVPVPPTDSAVSASTSTVIAPSVTTSGPDATASVPGGDATEPTGSVVPAPVEARTVTIIGAEIVLARVPGWDGSAWLVPAYRLTGDDGDQWLVLGIDDAFVSPPAGTGGASPGASGSGGSVGPGVQAPGSSSVPAGSVPTTGTTQPPPTTGTSNTGPAGGATPQPGR